MSDFSDAFNAGSSAVYRGQQMRSQEAMRRANERLVAQKMALELAEHDLKVQQFAEVAKAHARFQMMSIENIPLPNGTTMPNPAYQPTGRRVISAFLPTARTGAEAANIVQDAALIEARELMNKQIGQPTPRSPSQVGVDKARKRLLDAQKEAVENGKSVAFAPTDIEKKIKYFESRGITLTPDQLQKVANITLGIDAKAGTEEARADAELRVFTMLRPNRPKSDTDGKVLRDARNIVRAIYDENALEVSQPTMPKVGDVLKGYRFNGKFPPSDKRAWDKVQ